ncbi:MAG: dTDP-4-dehydrorhamnose reductase [Candidatus Omnitrophica bacterium CG11_big_fil_rev_8_21_14_0_20_42_13]|uniref:dTDP-4-dehydrorhamnose reductase n=1 Tax=Candidatus Ghiorseimicrobium undicola TaxID=1974746 RepID=A0A2H0LYD8_9BACT|nr:MAG: dTDP-4-dehydrorhamnose reductase [Candidatus Omnitrophica bacterium CG11_big_fil_rev_8_21_14_0_20_42_13]
MSKQKVIVTGSSGMLGRALCGVLDKDYQVFGIDLENRSGFKKFVKCDITKRNEVRKVFSAHHPDVVVHAAAFTDVDACESRRKKAKLINTGGTINLARIAGKMGSIFVFLSTDYVFDGRKKRPYLESDKPRPLNFYGRTKLLAENFIRRNLDKYFIIRTTWLYGKGGKNFINTVIKLSRDRRMIKIVDDQKGAPTNVMDLAESIGRLLEKAVARPQQYKGIYNITNSGSCSWYSMAKEIVKKMNLGVKTEPIKSKELKRPAKRPLNSVLNNNKFKRLVKKPMRNWKDALSAYLIELCAANGKNSGKHKRNIDHLNAITKAKVNKG